MAVRGYCEKQRRGQYMFVLVTMHHVPMGDDSSVEYEEGEDGVPSLHGERNAR